MEGLGGGRGHRSCFTPLCPARLPRHGPGADAVPEQARGKRALPVLRDSVCGRSHGESTESLALTVTPAIHSPTHCEQAL